MVRSHRGPPPFTPQMRLSRHHEIADQPRDLPVPHVEYVAKDQVEKRAILFGGPDGALSYDDMVFLNHPAHRNRGVADKSLVNDVSVEVVLALRLKCARNHPRNIVSQAGENL